MFNKVNHVIMSRKSINTNRLESRGVGFQEEGRMSVEGAFTLLEHLVHPMLSSGVNQNPLRSRLESTKSRTVDFVCKGRIWLVTRS